MIESKDWSIAGEQLSEHGFATIALNVPAQVCDALAQELDRGVPDEHRRGGSRLKLANWKVAWHQDLTIAVRDRLDLPGFGPWSRKAGVHHVQPPVSVLERMLAVRLHLDDCDERNGPLRVIPGTHRSSRLSSGDIDAIRATNRVVLCPVAKGNLLVMRPILLHASAQAASPDHRRVLHVEYACDPLPHGLRWSVPHQHIATSLHHDVSPCV